MRRQRVATARDDRVFTNAVGQFAHLGLGTPVDTVKHTVHKRRATRIHRQHAGTDGTAGDGLDLGRINAAFGQKSLADINEITPPVFFRSVLGPSRLRHQHLVAARRPGVDRAFFVDKNAFGFVSSDINAKRISHQV